MVLFLYPLVLALFNKTALINTSTFTSERNKIKIDDSSTIDVTWWRRFISIGSLERGIKLRNGIKLLFQMILWLCSSYSSQKCIPVFFLIKEVISIIIKKVMTTMTCNFQTPYYWPSQHHTPDNIEYAIYLDKRSQRNRQKHGLEDYELVRSIDHSSFD